MPGGGVTESQTGNCCDDVGALLTGAPPLDEEENILLLAVHAQRLLRLPNDKAMEEMKGARPDRSCGGVERGRLELWSMRGAFRLCRREVFESGNSNLGFGNKRIMNVKEEEEDKKHQVT